MNRRERDALLGDDSEPGRVRRHGQWAIGGLGDDAFAVSRRCRHQFADLSQGRIDGEGCLVCPWHGSRYDVGTGAMVDGPRGFLWYRGPAPGYSAAVRAFGRVVRLRVGSVQRRGARVDVRSRARVR